MVELSEEEWPIVRRWKAAAKTRARYMAELSRKVYQRFGEEGLKVIGEVWREGAEKYFLRSLKTFGIEGNNAKAFALYFKLAQEVLGYEMELVEATDKRAVLRYYTCHLFDKSDPIAERICRECNFQFEKRAAELLNPKLEVRFTKLQTAGDPHCEMIVELQE